MKPFTIIFSFFLMLSCTVKETPVAPKTYTIEQFYKNTRIGGGAFSDDEKKLLVSSDESGIFNLYEINIKDGSRKQLTFSEQESFFALDYVPGTNKVLYSADKGGNEINHIYLMEEGQQTVDLTPQAREKAMFYGWSEDKQHMYYLSNKRDSNYFDLYKMKISDWSAEMLYQNDKGLDISNISHDEQTMSINQPITTSENKLFLMNRADGSMIEISEEPGNYFGSGFSKDDAYFYYITNVGKEFAYLVQYEMSSGDRETLYETNWNVMYSYLSENEKYRVIAINEDGKNNLILLDNTTKSRVDFPNIPDADVTSVSISESEKLMRLRVGSSKAPGNIYVYNIETKDLKKLTETLNPEINPDDLVSAEVVRFKSFDGLEIPAIYYKPLVASSKSKVSALVWVHGGPGGQSRVGYFSLIQYLVNHGYAILAVNNRGSSGYGKTFYKMDDQNHGDKDLKDCVWGKKWLQEQEYIDPDKIGIIGGSYGGYMTMAGMTFTPDEFTVGVNIFGVTNWIRTLKSIPSYWESFKNALYAEMGDPYSEDSVRLYNISPLFHAENVKNPVMVLQGANDPRVLQVESDEIVEAVRNNGVHVEYIVFPDEGHGFIKKENEIEGYGKILQFLDEYLKGDAPVK